MRLQFHREMYAAYAVLVAASASFYAACAVLHLFFDDSFGTSPVVPAAFTALIAVAFSTAVFIVWRRPKDFAGWIGLIWWGGGALLSVYAVLWS